MYHSKVPFLKVLLDRQSQEQKFHHLDSNSQLSISLQCQPPTAQIPAVLVTYLISTMCEAAV